MKEKGTGWRQRGKKVGFSGHQGKGGHGTPISHPEGGGDEGSLYYLGMDQLIRGFPCVNAFMFQGHIHDAALSDSHTNPVPYA